MGIEMPRDVSSVVDQEIMPWEDSAEHFADFGLAGAHPPPQNEGNSEALSRSLHDVSEKPEYPVEHPLVTAADVDEQMIAKGPISFRVDLGGRFHRKPRPQIEVILGAGLLLASGWNSIPR
jgi:hypothetical protein